MDYRGQQLSEYIYYILTILFGAIAWVVGFVQGDFSITVYGWAVGLGLSMLLCIPDWPFFNRNPVEWLQDIDAYEKSTDKTKAPALPKSESQSAGKGGK